jgi:hypothetical protein
MTTGLVLTQKVLPMTEGSPGSGFVVGVRDQAASSRGEAEGAEVVAGDEFTHDGAGGFLGAVAADGDRAVAEARLHGGEFLELGEVLFELLPGVGGEEGVGVVVGVATGVDAAVVVVAEAEEGIGVGDREVAHEDGVDEGEDGGVGPDAESEGEDGGGGKTGGLPQLAQRIAHVVHQGEHWLSPLNQVVQLLLDLGCSRFFGGGPACASLRTLVS